MGSTSRYGNERMRRRRALRRLSGRDANRLPPPFLRALGGRDRRGRRTGLVAAGGAAAFLSSLLTSGAATLALVVALGVGAVAGVYAYAANGLPDIHHFEARPFGTTRIYDRHGQLLSEISDPEYGWRTDVPISQISPYLLEATIAAEDPSFRTNAGVDPLAIIRAASINFNGEGSSGGSTITQQLVRALYPESIGDDPTLMRKAREAIEAVRFAKAYSKDQVLQLYLNEIYYGNLSYGIEAAAESYFNKPARDLDLAEASLLAGLPQAPSAYDPRNHFELAKARQRYVLDQMVRTGYITAAEADKAFAQPLVPLTRQARAAAAPHFVNYVRAYIEEKYGADRLYRGNLRVYTTLDLATERAAEQIVKSHVQQLNARNATDGALVAILPSTGEILAMVGSADFYDDAIAGQVNMATSERQPGSSIKPMVYAATFEQGWSPATVIMDVRTAFPATFKAAAELASYRDRGLLLPEDRMEDKSSFYVPLDFDLTFRGAVTVRTALQLSLNIPAVKAIQYAGIDNVLDMAHRLGIRSGLWRGANYYGYTLALGGGEVQLVEHTNAYATFANGGRYVPLTPILKIEDATTGKTLEQLDRQGALAHGQRVLDPGIAYQITSVLTDNQARVPEYGEVNPLIVPELHRPAAAKTGTTNDNRDTWTMGYTTDLAVGVWVGNANNAPMNGVLGSQGPAPIWHDFMVAVHQRPDLARNLLPPSGQAPPFDFARPADVVDAQVCAATGKKPTGPGQATRTDVFLKSHLPAQPCDMLTPEENDELRLAILDIGRDRASFAPGAIESILDYQDAVANFSPVPTQPPRRRRGP
ncbi:MAG TPA: transglycosylase domain-containing protein [Thermomicrobiales bacterium]|nr:transglycosylase domain-containing protein [Thermomicrobiales bacterium]